MKLEEANAMQPMTIGRLAKAAGIGIETIRYYERMGLIQKPKNLIGRTYRAYEPQVVDRLAFIRRAKGLGFSLKEITELLSLRAKPKSKCASVKSKALKKISEVEQKIIELTRIKAALEKLTSTCDAESDSSECPILDALVQGESL